MILFSIVPCHARFFTAREMNNTEIDVDGHTIINGENVDITDFPWHAVLYFDSTFYCGGSLIATNAVLTAAHCLVDQPKAK